MSEVWIHRISYVWHMKPQEAQGVVWQGGVPKIFCKGGKLVAVPLSGTG
jgi:hypothetical protein